MIRRQEEKKQVREFAQRKEIERNLKKSGIESVVQDLSVSDNDKVMAQDIVEGRATGRNVVHVWNDECTLRTYNGRMTKLKANKKYKIAYWGANETYDDAVDYDVSMYELAVDLLLGDLILSE